MDCKNEVIEVVADQRVEACRRSADGQVRPLPFPVRLLARGCGRRNNNTDDRGIGNKVGMVRQPLARGQDVPPLPRWLQVRPRQEAARRGLVRVDLNAYENVGEPQIDNVIELAFQPRGQLMRGGVAAALSAPPPTLSVPF